MNNKKVICPLFLIFLVLFVSVKLYAEEKCWSWDTEIGYVQTAGNSSSTSANVKSLYKRKWEKFLLTLKGTHISSSHENRASAESYSFSEKGDIPFSRRFYTYELVGWEKDRFAGIDSRYNMQLGIGYKFIETEKHLLSSELGGDYTIEECLSGNNDEFGSLRGYLKYAYALSDTAECTQEGEILYNLEDPDDRRTSSMTALSASLSTNLSLKISYTIKYDNVPAYGFKKTDTILSSSIILRL